MDPKEKLPAEWPPLHVPELLRRLVGGDVDFVIVGGIAMMFLGSARFTRDLDICFSPATRNLRRLGAALTDLDARLRGVPGSPEDLPFVPDAKTLGRIELLTLSTSLGWLDVHRELKGAPPYRELRRNAERLDAGGVEVLVASPDDMIAMKAAAGRPLDRADIAELEAIKRLRARVGQ